MYLHFFRKRTSAASVTKQCQIWLTGHKSHLTEKHMISETFFPNQSWTEDTKPNTTETDMHQYIERYYDTKARFGCRIHCLASKWAGSIVTVAGPARDNSVSEVVKSLRMYQWQSFTHYEMHTCTQNSSILSTVPSMLWCCWLGGRKGIRPSHHLLLQ